MRRKYSRAFTLIELLVVVAIIGVLASVVLASLNSARVKGADARRKADLAQIRTALELYYSTCGTYVVALNCTGIGYGWEGLGSGWFSYMYGGASAGSVAKGLKDNLVTGGLIVDPSGMTSSNSVDRSGYMIVADQNYYTVWANLQNPTALDIATQNSCRSSAYDSYLGTYPVAAQMNYCISN